MATDRKTRQYSDINLLFSVNAFTKDITKKYDEEAVKASLKNLVFTRNYERPFHPEIGCQVYSLLFENFNPITRSIIKKTIFDVIEKFEPRVKLIDVQVDENVDSNEITLSIVFKLINSEKPVTLTTAVSRIR